LLIPLAVTSTAGMVRRLGKRWQQLHRLIYLIAIGGVIHYWWLVKADIRLPLIYGTILTALLVFRMGATRWRSVANTLLARLRVSARTKTPDRPKASKPAHPETIP
jgi:sulfoxide reductase heme-binding subunit YedZ